MVALHLAFAVHAGLLEGEDFLHGDHLPFHAGHFRDGDDLPGAVHQAGGLDDDVDGRRDVALHGDGRQVQPGHGDHGLQAHQCVARGVGVDGGQGAVVAGVHGLEHVQGLGGTDLAHDDAVGPHTQAVLDQVAHGDLALALDVGRAGLQPDHVILLELQLGRVLDGHDALVLGHVARQTVEQRGLARAGTAGDEHVELRPDDAFHELGHLGGQRVEADQVGHFQRVLGKLTNGERRPVDGQGRDDRVDARAVQQAGVAQGLGFVDAAADHGHDAVDDLAQVVVVLEPGRGQLQQARALHVDLIVTVDQDIVHRGVLDEGFQRSQADDLVLYLGQHALALGHVQRRVLEFLPEQPLGHLGDLGAHLGIGQLVQQRQVDHVDETAVDAGLDVEIVVLALVVRLPGHRLDLALALARGGGG